MRRKWREEIAKNRRIAEALHDCNVNKIQAIQAELEKFTDAHHKSKVVLTAFDRLWEYRDAGDKQNTTEYAKDLEKRIELLEKLAEDTLGYQLKPKSTTPAEWVKKPTKKERKCQTKTR